jgi:uncharacterized protein involved in exopolysaccharide biosynthesis
MLQKVEFEEDFVGPQADLSYLLQPAFYWQLCKRRWAYFVLPFITVLIAGVAGTLLWPPTYLAEGKILVQSQQIPSDLVRSTITSAAQERIQVIQQRTMTRDNLIAIADKFKLFPDKRALMSPTELVDAVKDRTKIAPVDPILDFKQRTRASVENPTIIFSVGFEYQDPIVAAQVANELITRILSEDLRDRTARATDTTKFLTREVQRLQGDNATLDARIAQLRLALGRPATSASGSDQPTTLNQLKAELALKSTLYSDRHPVIQSLKKQIDALEKVATASGEKVATASGEKGATGSGVGNDVSSTASLDALVAQQEALQKNLDTASAKLLAARLGENLEKDQQSEKLEIVESPAVPQEPVKPKRLKILALVLVGSLMAGAGATFLSEFADKSIRRTNQLLAVVDGQLVLSIPYIVTAAELRSQKRRRLIVLFASILSVVLLALMAYVFLPPLDLLIAKARVGMFR